MNVVDITKNMKEKISSFIHMNLKKMCIENKGNITDDLIRSNIDASIAEVKKSNLFKSHFIRSGTVYWKLVNQGVQLSFNFQTFISE